jgi:hypothetical protein
MNTYVLVHTSIFPKFWCFLILPCPLLDTRRYQAVQGSTRKSCTPGYGGTRRYKALYLHVLPCTCISRGTGLSGTAVYLIVPISLPCTALYRLVSRRGQEDTRLYDSVPEWTSWHVPVCIRIFQQGEICVVHAGMY